MRGRERVQHYELSDFKFFLLERVHDEALVLLHLVEVEREQQRHELDESAHARVVTTCNSQPIARMNLLLLYHFKLLTICSSLDYNSHTCCVLSNEKSL